MKKNFLIVLSLIMTSVTQMMAQNFSGYTVADEGAWCWFADPRALHYENKGGTINSTYIGYIDYHGAIKATQVDYLTGKKNEVMVRSWFQPDDHDNPAFLVLPDERIMIIYSRHTDEACFYYRISKRPGDITCLGEEKRLATANNTTYPNPFILSDDPEHIYMCWRGIGWHPTVAQMSMPDENDNIKFTWGPYQMVQSTGARPYAKYMSNGKDKIYLSYTTGHPDNEYPNWLYCNAFDINDKCLYDVKGNKLSTVASGKFNVNKTESYKSNYPYTVVDATADRRDWLWNMAFDKAGNPVIGMTKINNGKTSHDYYYAKWNGTAWQNTFIVNGGGQFHQTPNVEMCYSGGMAVDRDNPQDVYCSVPVNGVYEIVKYTMSEDGKKVQSTEAVTSGSTENNARPFVIEGTKADDLRLSWMHGKYYYWIVNTTYKNAYPTSIMANKPLPVDMKATEGKTISCTLTIDPANYKGDIITCGNVTWGVDASTQKSYIKIGDKTYKSQNVLGTADSWQTENNATTDGRWLSKKKLGQFSLVITEDGKRTTVYINGIIDQQVDELISVDDKVTASANATMSASAVKKECMAQDAVKQAMVDDALSALVVPATVNTDIVLPSVVSGGKGVEWTSSNPDVLTETGLVTFPKKATKVVLTAKCGENSKDFEVTVNPRDIKNNLRTTLDKVDGTANTAAGFSSNKYGKLDEGLLKGLRSYTVVLKANAKSLANAPRLYDFGAGSGNSVFLRANSLAAGVKYNGGTTTMVEASRQLTTGKDYKLAVTFDAATKVTKIYLDGEEVASGTANQNEPYMIYESAGDARNYVGRTQWWDSNVASSNVDFVGTISDLAVYDLALTQKEVCNILDIPFQEKEYATELTNTDFEGSYSAMSGSGVTNDRAIYVPNGWMVDYSTRNENDLTALKAGDLYYSNFFAGKPQNTNGGKQTVWVRQRWGDSDLQYYQEVKLPEGKYSFSVDMITSDKSQNSYVYVNTKQLKPTVNNAWQTLKYELAADGETVYKIGVRTYHPGSAAECIYGFDNFKLERVYDKGDVNRDGVVNIDDVTDIINVICGGTPNPYADVNDDKKVDIDDVTVVIAIICGQ